MCTKQYVEELIESQKDKIIKRADWIRQHRPQYSNGLQMYGGEEALILYDDAQLCYIYGTYSGAIVLGQSFIEQSVCAKAYAEGEFAQDEEPGYHDAVEFLDQNDILLSNGVEGAALDSLHNLRNSVAHFRDPTNKHSVSRQITKIYSERTSLEPVTENVKNYNKEMPSDPSKRDALREDARNEALIEDAKEVLKTVFSVARLSGVGKEID
jgi:hypothetical protein